MRLTLRTILAYLDDVLEPAQARELGEKIAESKEAADLMSRIREVIRRRRIGAPELAGPGSGPDPNIVSDYLENLLPPEQVVELERLCQSSDLHLAEVAACHKILSMVLGTPIDVSDEMRERMYALGSARTTEPEAAVALPAMAEGMDGIDPHGETGLPEYLTRRSFLQKYGLVLGVCACTLFWIGLVLTDQALWSRRPMDVANAPAESADQRDSAAEGGGLPQPVGPGADSPVAANKEGTGGAPLVAANPANPTVGIVPPAPGPNGAMPAPPASNVPVLNPVPPAIATPPATMPAVPPQAAVEVPQELPFTYQSGDEFDIKRLANQSNWVVHPVNVPIEVDDEIASPPPFRNNYGIANKLDISLEPGTRLQRLPRTATTIFGLALNRGQLTLSRPFTTEEAVTVELMAAGRSRNITLLTPGTKVAVELIPPQTSGVLDSEAPLAPEGGLVVVAGQIRVSTQGEPDLEIGENDGYARWPADRKSLVLKADLGIPGWVQAPEVLSTPAVRQLSRLYQKEFLNDRTIAQCIGPVVNDRRAGISELAVKTLAMIDQYSYLVTGLQSDHLETRLASIDGLRRWLGQNPEINGELLQDELSKVFRGELVPTLTRLLWGFSTQDARNTETSRALLDWMKDDQLAIRQLAFEFVSRVVGKTYDYLPTSPLAERRAALVRWEEYLKRNGGTLLPQETPASAAPAAPAPAPPPVAAP